MENDNFTSTFTAPCTPSEAFSFAAQPNIWWNTMISGSARHVAESFIYEVPGIHYSKFRVSESLAGRRLSWQVIPSEHRLELDEWVGTDVIFEFVELSHGTRVDFTHVGLRPQLACHSVCTTAWGHHLTVGLQALMAGAEARPVTPSSAAEVAAEVGAQKAG